MKPVYVATWRFGTVACRAGWPILTGGGAALDAVEAGANAVELDTSVQSVGYGGLPNAEGVVELDACIMDGPTHNCGAVAGLTGVRRPISVARRVMESTPHVMLVGLNARRFALQQGFPDEDLMTDASRAKFQAWRAQKMEPDVAHFEDQMRHARGHDTVGVLALDTEGRLAGGCTTSGLAWKLPGRVGDSPIIGSGLYVDQEAGAAVATGNGDEIMKVGLSLLIVQCMRRGGTPQEACEEALSYLLRKRADVGSGAACLALSPSGDVGSAATVAGFRDRGHTWEYAIASDQGIVLCEGAYVASP